MALRLEPDESDPRYRRLLARALAAGLTREKFDTLYREADCRDNSLKHELLQLRAPLPGHSVEIVDDGYETPGWMLDDNH